MVNVKRLRDLAMGNVTIQMTLSVVDFVGLKFNFGIAMVYVNMLENLAMESVNIQMKHYVRESVFPKTKHGIAMVNVNMFGNLVMGFAYTQDKNVATNVLIWLKIRGGNAMVYVSLIIKLATECAPLWEMCHTSKKVT